MRNIYVFVKPKYALLLFINVTDPQTSVQALKLVDHIISLPKTDVYERDLVWDILLMNVSFQQTSVYPQDWSSLAVKSISYHCCCLIYWAGTEERCSRKPAEGQISNQWYHMVFIVVVHVNHNTIHHPSENSARAYLCV